jgi:hypothetical protein
VPRTLRRAAVGWLFSLPPVRIPRPKKDLEGWEKFGWMEGQSVALELSYLTI